MLEEKGYKVDLQYANNDVNTQIQQLENMITKNVKSSLLPPLTAL